LSGIKLTGRGSRQCGSRLDPEVVLMSSGDGEELPGPPEPTVTQDSMSEFAGIVVDRLFSIGLSLESARSIVGNGPAGDRVATATGEVDELISDIRATVFRSDAGPLVAARERSVRTARALQARALDAAALLERRAEIARPPSRMDYQAEIKRWRAFAGEAEQMAQRWEQPP
jgi:hypothetical protein